MTALRGDALLLPSPCTKMTPGTRADAAGKSTRVAKRTPFRAMATSLHTPTTFGAVAF